MLEFKQYKIDSKAKNLVIFLHGHNGNLEDHQYAIDWLLQNLQNAILITPAAPEICDKNPQKRQWFSILKYDEKNKRRQPQTDVADIFAIYDLAAAEIENRALEINDFISKAQKKLKIDNAHTFLIGFSQGAMLAIYTALSRPNPIGGAFSLSGLIAAQKQLGAQIKSYPKVYMFHGIKDTKVQYKMLDASIDWLKKNKINAHAITYSNLEHRIIKDEIQYISQIINSLEN